MDKKEKDEPLAYRLGWTLAKLMNGISQFVRSKTFVTSASILVGLLLWSWIPQLIGTPRYCVCAFTESVDRPTSEATKLENASQIFITASISPVEVCIGRDRCKPQVYVVEGQRKSVKQALYYLEQYKKPDFDNPTGVTWLLNIHKKKHICILEPSDKKQIFYLAKELRCHDYVLFEHGVFDTPLW